MLLVVLGSEVDLEGAGVVGGGSEVGGQEGEAGPGPRGWQREAGAPGGWRVALSRSLRTGRRAAMPRLGWEMPLWLQGCRVREHA